LKVRKSKIIDGCHLENQKQIAISQRIREGRKERSGKKRVNPLFPRRDILATPMICMLIADNYEVIA